MATRINTKFVITLASIIVLLALGLVAAAMVLKKNAADHVRLAEKSLAKAAEIEAQGLSTEEAIKLYNAEVNRAAKHYGSAKNKDSTNVEHLYNFIAAHQQIICLNLTTAGNELESILAGAATIHDTPGASDADRAFLYELLHERVRIGLGTTRSSPLGNILGLTAKRLDAAPDDPVAKKYRALAVSYMAGNRTDESEIEQDLENITAAVNDNPETPWLRAALARHHLGNARRIFRANGNTETPEVHAQLALAQKHATDAIERASDAPADFIDAAGILAELRTANKELMASIQADQIKTVKALDQMLQDKANRDSLFIEELGRAMAILNMAPADDEEGEEAFNGRERAQALAELLPVDRPDEPAAYEALGTRQRETGKLNEAEQTITAGLAIKRLNNARQFIRDQRARLNMSSTLADIKCTLAAQSGEPEQREAMLKEAGALVDDMAQADTLQTQWRDARVDFLRGRIALTKGLPRQAVTLLERANRAYNSRDAQTLRLLAQTHAQLGNEALVVGFYETIINNNLSPRDQDLLNLINLYLAPGENQQLDKAESQLKFYKSVRPDDIRAVRLEARLLAERGSIDKAITLLEQHLDEDPDLINLIASYKGIQGDTEGVINIMRERLANRAEGTKMNMQLITQLINLLPDAETKSAELDRLVEQGLDAKVAAVFKRVLTSGEATLQDELDMVDIRFEDPSDAALQKFLAYRRRGDLESGRPFLDKALQENPENALAIEWTFRLALNEQRYEDARIAIDNMLALDTEDRTTIAIADGQFMRAQLQAVQAIAMEEGEQRNKAFRQAIVSYNNALGEYSHYVDGWVQLGRLHLAQNNFFAAQDSLLEALNRQSRNAEAMDLMARAEIGSGDQVNAMVRYEQILAMQPGNATALNQHTAIAQQLGQPERAIALREQTRERVPNNFDNRRRLAALYSLNEDHAKAKSTIQDVITAEGSSLQNVATLADIQGRADEHDQAVALVKGYLADRGEEATWQDHLLLARTHEAAGQSAPADAAYAKSIEMEKAEGTFMAALAQTQGRIARGQAKEAAEQFEQLAAQFPENDGLKQRAAELYLQLRNFEKAESIAKQMTASANRSRLLMQSAALQENKLGVAIDRARQAVKDYPTDFGLRLNLVDLLRGEQDRKEADDRDYNEVLRLTRALVSDHPDRVEAKVSLADVLLRLDRRAQATAELEKALEFAPRHLATNDRLFAIKLGEARLLATSNPELSRERAREALAIIAILIESRPNVPAFLRNAGQAASLAGLTAQSVDYFRQAFEATNTVEDLAAYASALLSAGQGATARSVLEGDNATLVANNLFLRTLRGRALAAAGLPDAAENVFKSLLSRDTEPGEQVMIARQVAQAFVGEPNRAIKLLEDQLGENLPVDVDLTIASLLMSQKKYTETAVRLAKYFNEPIDDVATQFQVLMQLALSQQESDQLTQAKATYEVAYEKMNKHKDIIADGQRLQMLNNMSYLLADQLQGYEKDAVTYAEQAVALIPDGASPRQAALIEDTLGWAYHKAGRTEDAIRVLKGSVRKFALAANQLHLGQAYMKAYEVSGEASDKDQAVLTLQEAVRAAKQENDAKLTEKAEKWFKAALALDE